MSLNQPLVARVVLDIRGTINMLINQAQKIPASIFRHYDIRGIADTELSEDCVYGVGRVLGSMAREANEKVMTVGRDGRLSGPKLSAALCRGILASGCDVIDIGLVPTPLLYYTTHVMNSSSGVMLTGSHNPAEYNGLKMVLAGETLAEETIQEIYKRVCNQDYDSGRGELFHLDVAERYVGHVTRDVKLKRPLKIVIDCGNGAAGKIAPQLFKTMGCEVIELFCEIDGTFPNHHPDPSQTENLQDLIRTVKSEKADIGLAFDGDGDRLGVVTCEGEVIWPDRQVILFAKSILEKKPGAKIIYDVKCTNHLDRMIREFGGEPIMWKTGHSLIKKKLAETKAAMAGEMSGHLFFKDRWYGFDDALYAGARLLEILAATEMNSATLFNMIPNSVNTPELKVTISDHEKFSFMQQLASKANFGNAEITTIDGLRVNFADGWGLVRSSNTSPCLVLRFEAETEKALKKIQSIFRDQLLAIKPDLALSF